MKALEDAGVDPSDERFVLLENERQSVMAGKLNPGPPGLGDQAPPVEAGRAEVEKGEIECEPLRPFTDSLDFAGARCLSVLRPDGSYLMVFIPTKGKATAIKFMKDGVEAVTRTIPSLPDRAAVTLVVNDEGDILVAKDGKTIATIPTKDW